MRQALIVFVKNPIHGTVKTRLAQTVGDDVALHVYQCLLDHTYEVAAAIEVDTHICYSDHVPLSDRWIQLATNRTAQKGNDLGMRMHYALGEVLESYDQAVLIGSDCPQIQPHHITRAFDHLNSVEYVLGPAVDGGYYLVGMREANRTVFEGIEWSTGIVLRQTLRKLASGGHEFALLEPLRDLDTEEDLRLFPEYAV